MDLFLTHEGDLALDLDTNDIQTVSGTYEQLQEIAFRLKTKRGSLEYDPSIGNSLHQLVGTLLTPESLAYGERLIYDALSDASSMTAIPVVVRGIPINNHDALFVITLSLPTGRDKIFMVPFNYEYGAIGSRSATAELQAIFGVLIDAETVGVFPE